MNISSSASPPYDDAVVAADVNGDGLTDLVVMLGYSVDQLFVLLQGDGGFTPVLSTSGLPGTNALSMAAGDFNHDGMTDLVVGTQTSLSLWLGDGHGGFSYVPTNPFGKNTHGQSVVVAADVNGDGLLDVVAAYGSPTISVFLGLADGGFSAPAWAPLAADGTIYGLAVEDVNGDGRMDIAATVSDETPSVSGIDVFFQQATGGFRPPTLASIGQELRGITALQVGSSKVLAAVDQAVGVPDPVYLVSWQDAGFQTASLPLLVGCSGFNCPIGPGLITAADLNQDGLTDLAVLGVGGDTLAVLFQAADGGFCPAPFAVVEGSPAAGRALAPFALSTGGAVDNLAVVYTSGGQQNQEAVTLVEGGAP